VQTVLLSPKQSTVEIATPIQSAKPIVQPTLPKPAPKSPPKPAPKTPAKPAPKPVAKPSAKPAPKAPPKEIAQADTPVKKGPSQQALATLKQKLAAIPTAATTKQAVGVSGSVATDVAMGYEAELISKLKIVLKLPEMGDVKVSLTLNRQGKITQFHILSSVSAVNKKAVETHLPAISFPPFGQAYSGETTHTFTLTLTNL
jgi:hypothetical protein